MRTYKSLVYNGRIQRLNKIQVRETSPVILTYIGQQNTVLKQETLENGSIDIPLTLSPCILDISSSQTYIKDEDSIVLFTNGDSALYPVTSNSVNCPITLCASTRVKSCMVKGDQADIESYTMVAYLSTSSKVGVKVTYYDKDNVSTEYTYVFDGIGGRYNFFCTRVGVKACYYKVKYYCDNMLEIEESVFHYKGVPIL